MSSKYQFISGIEIITYTIKKLNIKLIKLISKEMMLNEDQTKDLLDKFVKTNYYTPEVVSDIKEEKFQQFFIS
tara:strand:+ start:16339 stop:16557 length:219 start_codon:yes stop_codon:yes gene_type:complete